MTLIKLLTKMLVKATENYESKRAKQIQKLEAYITRLEQNKVTTTKEMQTIQHFAASFDGALDKLD